MLQHTPLAVIVKPPSSEIVPPLTAEISVMSEISVSNTSGIVSLGRSVVSSLLQPIITNNKAITEKFLRFIIIKFSKKFVGYLNH